MTTCYDTRVEHLDVIAADEGRHLGDTVLAVLVSSCRVTNQRPFAHAVSRTQMRFLWPDLGSDPGSQAIWAKDEAELTRIWPHGSQRKRSSLQFPPTWALEISL